MTTEEKRVLEAARRWWKSRRPVKYTREAHLGNPTVNMSHGAEMNLAHAVATYEESKR